MLSPDHSREVLRDGAAVKRQPSGRPEPVRHIIAGTVIATERISNPEQHPDHKSTFLNPMVEQDEKDRREKPGK
jgi:hypothetical protein